MIRNPNRQAATQTPGCHPSRLTQAPLPLRVHPEVNNLHNYPQNHAKSCQILPDPASAGRPIRTEHLGRN